MKHKRMLAASICAALLAAMAAFHARADAVSASASGAAAYVEARAEEAAAPETGTGEGDSGLAGSVSGLSEDASGQAAIPEAGGESGSGTAGQASDAGVAADAAAGASGTSALDTSRLFTDRDMAQTADLSDATYRVLSDGETVTIKAAGVYVLSGTAKNAQIQVAAGDDDKVQIVLDGVCIENDSAPAIYVKNADKVFVTTTDSENSLAVTGSFTADGTTRTDAAIFSRDDLVLNGTGTLAIASTANGVTSKDDLKVTGGTIAISCTADALEANDSIRIADGTVRIETDKDGLHAENDEDKTLGYIYIGGGTLAVQAADDAIHATTIAQVDGGTLELAGAECIEATIVQVNGGTISIAATDDGINAGAKSDISTPTVEINGGDITIAMGAGDTDGIDSNGDLYLNGGTIDITAQSPFDYDGYAENKGATIIVNGEETDAITNQMMGGPGGMGGPGQGSWGQDGAGRGRWNRNGAGQGGPGQGKWNQKGA